MMKSAIRHPVAITIAVTIVIAAFSVIVVALAMRASGIPLFTLALQLSVAMPLIMVPLTVYPLLHVNRRQRQMRLELERLVGTDTLTGLPNRRAFFEFAEQLLALVRPGDAPLTAMMIDVDHFKAINDTYGHDAGDAVLKRVAVTIRDAVAASGAAEWTVARLGGEEFAILVDGLVPTAVARLAERTSADVRAIEHAETNETPTTVSIGVAFRAPGTGIDRLLKAADDAVYAAKRGGRNRWAFAGAESAKRATGRPVPEPANDRVAAG